MKSLAKFSSTDRPKDQGCAYEKKETQNPWHNEREWIPTKAKQAGKKDVER